MDDDRRGALLGNELEGARQLHAELALGRQDLEQLRVILEVRAGAVAPRVALALTGRHAQLVANLAMHPLGDRFRRLDGEAVDVERFGVFVRRLQLLEPLASPRRRR